MHVVYITRYVIRIKKHLHNRIEIIEMESNRKEYESSHPSRFTVEREVAGLITVTLLILKTTKQ